MTISDIHSAKTVLHEVATNAYTLAMGLQNAAPPQENNNPAPSVQYLLEAAIQLKQSSKHLEDIQALSNENEQQIKLIALFNEIIQNDELLRKKYTIVDRFRFVRDRLIGKIAADEVAVYVHLYNAQGTILRNWQTMITPKVFYEHSVNRPVYVEKKFIEALVKSKTNRLHHAYLTIAVKPADLIPQTQRDALNNPVDKVKEGALHFNKFIVFTHNEQDYILDEKGELVKKDSL